MRPSSLYLLPADPRAAPPALEVVLRTLRQRGLIGARLDGARFAAGDGLLDQIGFTGCSVAVKFEPASAGDLDYCHLRLLGPYPAPRPFTGDSTVKPRCPACRLRLVDWQALIEDWRREGAEPDWTCTSCGHRCPVSGLRWRRHAAFGRLLVEIRHIFPAEAAPHDALVEALEKATGIDWDYAWAGSSDVQAEASRA